MGIVEITQEIAAGIRRGIATGTADQISTQSSTAFFTGPTVPFPIGEQNRTSDMAGLSFGALRLSQSLKAIPISSSPVAASLAFAPALLHTRVYKLYNIGINPQKVLARGEWHRLVTGQLIDATFVQLLHNATDLYESGSWLEKRWGWQGLLGAVGAIASLAPALYVALTAFAHRLAPSSALGQQYYSAYFVSPSMVALGISVLCGYDQDIHASSRGQRLNGNDQKMWSSRYQWGSRLLLATSLSPRVHKVTNMHANICGIVAGLISVYAFGLANTRWRKSGGLGLKDVAIQGALLGFWGLLVM